MKVTSLVAGILGGLAGLAISIIVIVIGQLGWAFGARDIAHLIVGGWAALFLSLAGILGGALAISKPTTAGILMLVSGAGGFIALRIGYIFGGPLLIAGGVLALIAGRKQ